MGERVLGFAYRDLEGFSPDHAFTNKPEPNFPVNVSVCVRVGGWVGGWVAVCA
jgi:hypothetical protein